MTSEHATFHSSSSQLALLMDLIHIEVIREEKREVQSFVIKVKKQVAVQFFEDTFSASVLEGLKKAILLLDLYPLSFQQQVGQSNLK